jgi:hypothetical protein
MSLRMRIGRVVFSEVAPGLPLFARQWTRSPADAEDIVQEAFVKFWRRKPHGQQSRIALCHRAFNRFSILSVATSAGLDVRPMSTLKPSPTIEPQFRIGR